MPDARVPPTRAKAGSRGGGSKKSKRQQESDSSGAGSQDGDNTHSNLTELEERVNDLGDSWETESLFEDVLDDLIEEGGLADSALGSDPEICTPEEAVRYRQELRAIGPEEFCRRTVDAGVISAKRLLTAFGVRPPAFLEGEPDESYFGLLSLALSRELLKRAKLQRYNSVDDAVQLLQKSQNIIVLTGAGISTSLGIPDFRSKDTGLYSRLEHLGLSDPQEVFDINVFREDPSIFYSVARDILPATDRFTPTHAFIAMLQQREKLLTNYSQNIDNLEAKAGIRPDKLVQCHGSFATASCVACGYRVDGESIFPTIKAGDIPHCPECAARFQSATAGNSRKRKAGGGGGGGGGSNGSLSRSESVDSARVSAAAAAAVDGPRPRGRPRGGRAGRSKMRRLNRRGRSSSDGSSDNDDDLGQDGDVGVMKPDITFFGEPLPDEFSQRLTEHDRDRADLVVVIGTSLKVAPVSEVVPFMPPHVPQIYISRTPVHHINFDIDLLGDCDVVVAELCRRLGWDLQHEMVPAGQKVRIETPLGVHGSQHTFTELKEAAVKEEAVIGLKQPPGLGPKSRLFPDLPGRRTAGDDENCFNFSAPSSMTPCAIRAPADCRRSLLAPVDRFRRRNHLITHTAIMVFVGVYKAVYDYVPQSEGELAIGEGNLLYVLSKDGDDGWWKAKKKATGDDDEEPEGLVPTNYIEEAEPTGQARALYDYTRQTDEELSFPEDARLAIYDATDPDWILAGYEGEYGFVPVNYIDQSDAGGVPASSSAAHEAADEEPAPPSLSTRQAAAAAVEPAEPSPRLPPRSPTGPGPAAALAGVLAGRSAPASQAAVSTPTRQQHFPDDDDDESIQSPPLPTRPRPQQPPSQQQQQQQRQRQQQQRARFAEDDGELSPPLPQRSSTMGLGHDESRRHANRHQGGHEMSPERENVLSPGAFHLYNISEMVSVMGKRKKMPTTLGINLKTGKILIAPEKAQDGPSQEWSAERMTHYSREGKHVFMELVRPSKSLDLHAGAKDTAEEIVAALGELAGASRAEGLREVIMAGTGYTLKKGVILYDFMAQGDDEVTVAAGDEVTVLDDTRSEEWTQVRRVKNGKEGVVPSSYVEVTGPVASAATVLPPVPSYIGRPESPDYSPNYTPRPVSPKVKAKDGAGASITSRGTVAHNRAEEERMTRAAVRLAVKDEAESSRRGSEVGHSPEDALPLNLARKVPRSAKHEGGRANGGSSGTKTKPDATKVRTWTDRTKSFSVEAQFLGLKDSKISLHKMNGVKIAVPVAKMSLEDLEYVERMTGVSLDEDKPLSSLKRKTQQQRDAGGKVGASIEPRKPDYDWFQFFLSCEVAVGLCERYSQAFVKDNMDESVLSDIDATVLRTLGLREGDIIKVMRCLDLKYGRTKKTAGEGDADAGGLFSGPGGALRNNTRRGRPAPTTQTSDVVDVGAFSQKPGGESNGSVSSPPQGGGGFDDDAWDVKPSRQAETGQPAAAAAAAAAPTAPAAPPVAAAPAPAPAPVPPPAPPVMPALTGSLQELSLLTQPLPAEKLNPMPTAAPMPVMVSQPVMAPAVTSPPPMSMPGATPGFFTSLQQQGMMGVNGLQQQPTGMTMNGLQQQQQPTGMTVNNLQMQQTGAYARARPMAPQYGQSQVGLLPPPPPPSRPLSAPLSAQPSVFGPPPLQPQMTGLVAGQTGMMPMMTGMQGQFASQPMMMQPTGFQQQQQQQQQALQPQPTGHFTQGFGNYGMTPPAVPVQAPAPLMPQQTGPAPPVRFGVTEGSKLMPQATGRRANLSAATPDNPFGF
ncbi:cytoskeleton assembly control protein [Grosmannia clavigera kw1407]|uniref:Actin cytoskeleton-regulatory complex protein SLA1 n=1 Tax=Grosmannia clavigera (strain kw1407 / UAMH 11150) TaxID=655863 RepID=F0XMI9_GROCL|nr:cytoskeleton assembly control protein [Grosmannia clavigera kw1407]EFX01019.1 cytoskeleton assembly control protein [Grosmannia clavigera kw1407]